MLFTVAMAGCGANQSILESANKSSTPAANMSIEKSSLDQDMDAMRTAQFSTIYILRRKDGGGFDADDRAAVRLHTSQANRRVAADEGRAVIVGSNFLIPEKDMAALRERFELVDHSPLPADSSANENK
jgi:hypothetical protein